MPHAAVIETARPPRWDARPTSPYDPRRIRSGTGSPSDDRFAPRAWADTPGAQTRGGRRALAGVHVLVVDDDADVLELFAVVLTAAGADVSTTDNAHDAIALATRLKPDAIVSDIAMAGEDGYWLVRELRRLPADLLGPVPVIAATAYGREHPRARVIAAGFAEHVQKPVDPEQLCRLVATLVGR
jgi:CheY-like chemotaxis protein